jgi:uncharacterized protein YdeI (BOF family)
VTEDGSHEYNVGLLDGQKQGTEAGYMMGMQDALKAAEKNTMIIVGALMVRFGINKFVITDEMATKINGELSVHRDAVRSETVVEYNPEALEVDLSTDPPPVVLPKAVEGPEC